MRDRIVSTVQRFTVSGAYNEHATNKLNHAAAGRALMEETA